MKEKNARILFFILLPVCLVINAYPYYLRSKIEDRLDVQFLGLLNSRGESISSDLAGNLLKMARDQFGALVSGEVTSTTSDLYLARLKLKNNNNQDLKLVACRYRVMDGDRVIAWGDFEPGAPLVLLAGGSTEAEFPLYLNESTKVLKGSLARAEVRGQGWILIDDHRKLEVPFNLSLVPSG